MKNIELTEDHKSKLLEMCEELFPKYINYKWDIIHCTDDIKQNGVFFMYKKNGDHDEFHWFEFCMTHLARRLLSFNDITLYQTTGEFMYVHIVDYFYEKFKELK